MFYSLAGAFTQPYPFLMCGLLVSLLVLWRCGPNRRWTRRIAITCFLFLWLISTPLVSYLAVWSLERVYPPLQGFPEDAQAIVVLTGGIRIEDEKGQQVELGSDTAFRSLHAAELYRRAGHRWVIPSGGKSDPDIPGPTLAEGAGDLLLRLGVAHDDLLLENQSRTTYENAICCRDLLAKREIRRIVLVTDATHMPRAARCFRAVGFEVIPAPCNYRAGWFRLAPGEFLPSPDAAANLGTVCHEWFGLVWYWLHGRV